MKQSDIFRENAENCVRLAEAAANEPSFKRYSRMAEAWRALADEQDWLDGEPRQDPAQLSAAHPCIETSRGEGAPPAYAADPSARSAHGGV